MNFDVVTSSSGYRSAVASSDLLPGTCILTEKSLRTSLLDGSCRERYCGFCLREMGVSERKKCSGGCQGYYVCSKECQRKNHQVHKHTCKHYAAIVGGARILYERACGEPFPLDEFILLREAFVQFCIDDKVKPESGHLPALPPPVADLAASTPLSPPHLLAKEVALATACATSFSTTGLTPSNVAFFRVLVSKFRCNNFGVTTFLQTTIAHGVFPIAAVLNHSCAPNCVLVYSGAEVTIRTIKPVAKGEELFHSYVDVTHGVHDRRSHLDALYSFSCECSRCVAQSSAAPQPELLKIHERERIEYECNKAAKIAAESDDNMHNIEAEYSHLRAALSILSPKCGADQAERYRVEGLALNCAMLIGAEAAIGHAANCVVFLRKACPRFHPLLLLQIMTLAELCDALNDERTKELYEELVQGCSVVFGSSHEFTDRYRVLLQKFNVK